MARLLVPTTFTPEMVAEAVAWAAREFGEDFDVVQTPPINCIEGDVEVIGPGAMRCAPLRLRPRYAGTDPYAAEHYDQQRRRSKADRKRDPRWKR